MKQANIVLRLEKHGQDVGKSNVTPAEVALLVAEHKVNAGGNPVVSHTDAPDVTRTDVEEVARLKGIYGVAKVNALYPGLKPSLPTSFDEASGLGVSATIPVNKLLVKSP